MQFHVEVEADTVDNWAVIPEYRVALDSALGATGVEVMNSAVAPQMKTFNDMAERLYINWLQCAAQAR